MQLDLIEFAEAAARRDAGLAIAQANAPDWYGCAILQIVQMHKHRWSFAESDFIFEDIVNVVAPLIGKPPNRFVTGALCMQAIRRKIIEPTGAYRKATGLLKNCHRNAVYRWTDA